MSDGGKGSAPRPLGMDWKKFEENWDEIFGTNTSRRNPVGTDAVVDPDDRPALRRETGDGTGAKDRSGK